MKQNLREFLQHLAPPAIIQAPMAGGITTPHFVSAVCNAGGLGSLATGYRSAAQVTKDIRDIRQLTRHPFSANVFVPNRPKRKPVTEARYQKKLNQLAQTLNITLPPAPTTAQIPDASTEFHAIIDTLIAARVPIVSFTFGVPPAETIDRLKGQDTLLIGTATSADEAVQLEKAGVDGIIAQGQEAGGHSARFIETEQRDSTLTLVEKIAPITNLPIIAAGGIMAGEDIIQALEKGAAAVQMGTAFLCTQESGANPAYKAALATLQNSPENPTTVSNTVSGKAARGLHNKLFRFLNSTPIPDYPIANTLSSPLRKAAAQQNIWDAMSIWAGSNVAKVTLGLTVEAFMDSLRHQCSDQAHKTSTISR